MNKKIEYIEYNNKICFKCLRKHKDIKTYTLEDRGYGSIYDNFNSKLQLCPICRENIDNNLERWFYEIPTYEDYCEEYKYEEDISNYIKGLPVQGQELFENQVSYGACVYIIDSQDWIDIELGIAPDSTYKKYGYYSPSEVDAYKRRFPTCKHVYLKVWGDGSKGCRCREYGGATGNSDGSYGSNISDECYYCDRYERKESDEMPIKEVKHANYKIVEMIEVFCPTCEKKHLEYKHKLEDLDGYIYCSCGQEITINI